MECEEETNSAKGSKKQAASGSQTKAKSSTNTKPHVRQLPEENEEAKKAQDVYFSKAMRVNPVKFRSELQSLFPREAVKCVDFVGGEVLEVHET